MGDVRHRAPSPGVALSSPQIWAQSFLFWGKRCPLKGTARPSHTVPASSTAPSLLHLPLSLCAQPCKLRALAGEAGEQKLFLIPSFLLFFFWTECQLHVLFSFPACLSRAMTTVDIKKMVAGTDSLPSRRASPCACEPSRAQRSNKALNQSHPSVSFFKPCLLPAGVRVVLWMCQFTSR